MKLINYALSACILSFLTNIGYADLHKISHRVPIKIQEVIDAAEDGDTVIVYSGIYKGEGNINLDFCGKTIVLMSNNGPEMTIIDCESEGRAFYFHSGEDRQSQIIGFSILNGSAGASGGVYGGGVFLANSSPTITNCIISNCAASTGGGGLFCDNGNPQISNCIIADCWASGAGGMEFDYSTPEIIDCDIKNNRVFMDGGGVTYYYSSVYMSNSNIYENIIDGYDAAFGGGIYSKHSDLIIEDCVFSKNESHISSIGWQLGGGLCCEVGTLNISNCLFKDNYTELGGGIYLADVAFPEIYSCVFVGNIADFGGGIQTNFTTDCIIYECLLINNFAEYGGGIFYAGDVNLDIVNCTIHGNVADSLGGGIYGEFSNPDLINLIIWNNFPDQINKYSGETDAIYSDIEGGWPGEGNIDSDPLFLKPDSLDFNLLSDSPCIDAGDPGFDVPLGGGRRIDMGACEYWFGWNIAKSNFAD